MGNSALTLRESACHYIGAANEHLAATYFLAQKHQVYWPAMQQGAVDFVVFINGVFKRVQVKTATWNKSGPYKYLQCRTRLTKTHQGFKPSELYDLLVIVAPDGRIWVIPAEIVDSSNVCLDGDGPRALTRNRWQKFQKS